MAKEKERTPLEHELNVARKIGVLLKGTSLKQRARILALVTEHTAEEAAVSEAGKFVAKQLEAF